MMVRTAASTSLRLGFWASTLDVARSSACTLGLIAVSLHSGPTQGRASDIQPLDGLGAEWFPRAVSPLNPGNRRLVPPIPTNYGAADLFRGVFLHMLFRGR